MAPTLIEIGFVIPRNSLDFYGIILYAKIAATGRTFARNTALSVEDSHGRDFLLLSFAVDWEEGAYLAVLRIGEVTVSTCHGCCDFFGVTVLNR